MALLFMDGFGGQDAGFKWDVGMSYNSLTTVPRIPGGIYASANSLLYKTISASSQIFLGFGFRTNSSYSWSFFGDSGATTHITLLRNNVTGRLELRRGTATGTLLVTGSTVIANDQWNYVETSITISDTVGEVHVRLNGQTVDEISYTGDTKNGGTATTIDRFFVGSGTTSLTADLYVCDSTGSANNTFLGDVVVRTLNPNNNGTYSQLTGSDGNQVDNYLLVDERPFSSADYVGSATTGQKDTYSIADLPAGASTVYGVQVNGLMAKSDGTLGQARLVIRSGGTDYGGTTRALPTTYTGYYEIYEQDPATSTQWTVGGVNNLESGMEVM